MQQKKTHSGSGAGGRRGESINTAGEIECAKVWEARSGVGGLWGDGERRRLLRGRGEV